MSRRLIAAIAAILFAIVGIIMILSYVGSADQRALADLDPIEVLVVTQPVPEGAAAEDLTDFVALEAVPASAVGPGAVSALNQVSGQVTQTALQPGEQLLAHRFSSPEALAARGDVEVPAGLHQVTIQLQRVRVLGGHLAAGDTVGVFVSLFGAREHTQLSEHKILVTRVQGGIAPAPADGSEPAAAAEAIMVTLALDATAAAKIVWAAEHGAGIWLSLEDAEAPASDIPVVTPENIFE